MRQTYCDLNSDEAFKIMHQIIMAKIKKYARENQIAFDVIIKHSNMISECWYKETKYDKKEVLINLY